MSGNAAVLPRLSVCGVQYRRNGLSECGRRGEMGDDYVHPARRGCDCALRAGDGGALRHDGCVAGVLRGGSHYGGGHGGRDEEN